MSAAHRADALTKMRAHHAEAVRLRTSDPAASRAAAKRAEHAADVVKSIDAGAPVGTVDPTKDFLRGTLGLLPPAVVEEAAEEVVVELPLERYRVRVHLVLL